MNEVFFYFYRAITDSQRTRSAFVFLLFHCFGKSFSNDCGHLAGTNGSVRDQRAEYLCATRYFSDGVVRVFKFFEFVFEAKEFHFHTPLVFIRQRCSVWELSTRSRSETLAQQLVAVFSRSFTVRASNPDFGISAAHGAVVGMLIVAIFHRAWDHPFTSASRTLSLGHIEAP